MSICVLVVCFSICDSSRGVCRMCVGFIWLCIQIIDVSDGYTYTVDSILAFRCRVILNGI